MTAQRMTRIVMTSIALSASLWPVHTNAATLTGRQASTTGTVVVGVDTFPSDFNFFTAVQNTRIIYPEALIQHNESLQPVPAVAESWEITDGGRVLTFHLRHNARFQDGTSATAADVLYTYQLHKQSFPGADAAVASITAVDAHTVRFTLSKPQAAFLDTGLPSVPVAEKKQFQAFTLQRWRTPNWGTDYKIWPNGVSPWKMVAAVKGDHITYVPNPFYYGEKPKISQLILKVVPDDNALFEQLQSGEIQALRLLPRFLPEVDRGRFNTYSIPGLLWYRLELNMQRPFFTDPRVRQATMYAMDRASIVRVVYNGYANIMNAGIPPALARYYNPDVPNKYPYNPGKAVALLASAGWKKGSDGILIKEGQRLTFSIVYNHANAQEEQAATIMQQNLAAVGISVQLQGVEDSVRTDDFLKSKFDALLVDFGDSAYPGFGGYDFVYACGQSVQAGGFNVSGYCNHALDPILAAARTTVGYAAQKKVFAQMQVIMNQDLPWDYLYAPQTLWVMSNRVRGFVPYPLDWSNNLQSSNNWYLQ